MTASGPEQIPGRHPSLPPEPGSTTPPATPPGVIVPAGGATKLHVNFLQSTWDAGDLYLAGNPPELLVSKGSNQKGASARNLFVESEELIFFLRLPEGTDLYSTNPEVALLDAITGLNYPSAPVALGVVSAPGGAVDMGDTCHVTLEVINQALC